jgi:hypothetical protein
VSIIPQKNEPLDLFEGSTFDETWTVYEDDEVTLTNLTGWGAELKVAADWPHLGSPILLAVANGALVEGPTAKAIVVGDALGTLRIYVGSTIMAALNAADFTTVTEEGETSYTGKWDIELIKPVTLERFRYAMGPVTFSPEVTV